MYMGVILRAHPVRGESHIQLNSNREVATTRAFPKLSGQEYYCIVAPLGNRLIFPVFVQSQK